MIKKFVPTCHANSVYEVPADFYAKLGIKNILLDLDNTLVSYKDLHPSRRTMELLDGFKSAGYRVFLITNNKKKRIESFAGNADLPYIYSSRKPSRKKIARLMEEEKLKKEETMLVGDQLLTDCLAANRLGIKVLLTEKIVPEDQWTTRFNRLIDRPIRRYLKRKNLLTDWSEKYDRN